ncbi:MAG: hypothetical protein HKN07_01325 [Acidimicrobiia bacterium]|nr:hypothetical protein [Acidimicrobiia bacterium]
MAIDIAGFITYLKDHSIEHGFHVHDERHFLETYSLRQSFEVDLHPESACDGPLDLHLAFEIDPRTLLELEDHVYEHGDPVPQPERFGMSLLFNWELPSLGAPPDLVVLAAELAGIAGPGLPIDVSGVSSMGALATGEEHRLMMVAKVEVSMVDVLRGEESLCDVLDRCRDVSEYLAGQAEAWDVVFHPPE